MLVFSFAGRARSFSTATQASPAINFWVLEIVIKDGENVSYFIIFPGHILSDEVSQAPVASPPGADASVPVAASPEHEARER